MPIISETSIVQFMKFSFKFVSFKTRISIRQEVKTILKGFKLVVNQ